MSTREQFGKYLLLKKLAEDPLGETFRAGLIGTKGMERVALLRVMNGQGIDGQRLWAACRERAPIQQSLRSPNIGDGIEMGEVQGIPYVAYDYVSGKNLATLFDQATKQRSPISTDHALLVAERLSLALSVAAEHRFQGDRILHGFLVPHLVMISNEGETRLLGFEFAPGLRTFIGNPVLRRHFGRYLAPEALAGAQADKSDDVYSLGVLLFELLTGQPLPAPSGDGYADLIAGARLATEDQPIPEGPAQLLRQSLVPRERRLRDVAQWQKTLASWMAEGNLNPTTFNLAFYMHNLYRQDIERESQEIEVEKTLPLPVGEASTVPMMAPVGAPAAPAPTPEPASVPAMAPVVEPDPITSHGLDDTAGLPPKKSKTGLMIALAAVVLAALGGGWWWWSQGQASGGSEPPPQVATTAPTTGAAGNGAPLDGNAPGAMGEVDPAQAAVDQAAEEAAKAEEARVVLQQQIDGLVAEKANDMEEQLRAQMDQQLERLRGQLREAQDAAEERERELQAQQEAAAEARRLAQEEAARKAAEEEAARKAAEEEATRKAEEEAARLAAEEEAARLAAEVEAAKPKFRRGDLVESGPGIIPPRLIRFPPPRFPPMAKRLNRTDVTVPVRVLVDENGKVIEAKPESSKKFGFGFDAEALSVARGAEYEPATAEGVPVKMWMTLRVRFR